MFNQNYLTQYAPATGHYGMMYAFGQNSIGFSLMHFFAGTILLVWAANSILIGYLLVVLIQKYSKKK